MGNRSREGNLEFEREEEQTQNLPQNSNSIELENSVHENDNTENLSPNSEKSEGIIELLLLNENKVNESVTSKWISETIVQKNKRMQKDDIPSMIKESMIRRGKTKERQI